MKSETRLGKKIREKMKQDFGTILHKNHGGAFGETGAADYYGTLPGGRAIYIELKRPQTIGRKNNRAIFQAGFLRREAELGAVALVADSYEAILEFLAIQQIYPQSRHDKKQYLI